MSVSSQSDATPAYRGYRLQALYTLSRLLESNDSANFTFQPEGKEDLAIFDASNNLVEVVQVKAHSQDLALSSFKLKKSDSFFYRVAQLLKTNSHLTISIASFGEIGQEMLQACGENDNKRQTVARKLSEHKLSEVEADSLLAKIQLIRVKEAALTESVDRFLKETLTGVDPESAFELLNFWLYICAENKRKITRRDVVDRINKVGRFLAERAAHHKEWFTTIVPLEEPEIDAKLKDKLSNEFYRGISARYEHILADVDVLRSQKLQEIAKKFEENREKNRVVIIHGASGQGKTTLAFRYLHEFFPDNGDLKFN
jgi:flagellar biosynthesis GTPase FlhF